jgi:hypothetical protein
MLRRELPAAVREVIEAQETLCRPKPNDPTIIEFEWSTPAAIWLYVRYMRTGVIFETHLYGWAQITESYPILRYDSYLNALLASVTLAKEIEDTGFEQCVVAEIDKVVRASLGPIKGTSQEARLSKTDSYQREQPEPKNHPAPERGRTRGATTKRKRKLKSWGWESDDVPVVAEGANDDDGFLVDDADGEGTQQD